MAKPTQMLKSTKFWLIISVCFNLLLLGLFAGLWSKAQHEKDAHPPRNEMTAIIRVMPKDNRDALFERYRGAPQQPPRADIEQLADLIDAEPFDSGALREYFKTNRQANDRRVLAAQEIMVQNLELLSDEQRSLMAEELRHMPQRPQSKRPKVE